MQRIIINADDLGASLQVNQAIENCFKKGVISSSTIMAGGFAYNDAIRIAKFYPNNSFGVHLSLDEYKCITQPKVFMKEGLIDVDGFFIKDGYKRIKQYTKELKIAIQEEWNAQVKIIQESGILISHVDGHHHCHTLPALHDVLERVLYDNNIPKVRLPQSRTLRMRLNGIRKPILENGSYHVNINKPHGILQYARTWAGYLKEEKQQIWYKKHFRTTDFFCAASFYQLNKDYLKKNYPGMTIELMCHPGHPDYQLETVFLEEISKEGELMNYFQI